MEARNLGLLEINALRGEDLTRNGNVDMDKPRGHRTSGRPVEYRRRHDAGGDR
jgi:hypothetical protein